MELEVPFLEPDDFLGHKQELERLISIFSPPSSAAFSAGAASVVSGCKESLRQLQKQHPEVFLVPPLYPRRRHPPFLQDNQKQ